MADLVGGRKTRPSLGDLATYFRYLLKNVNVNTADFTVTTLLSSKSVLACTENIKSSLTLFNRIITFYYFIYILIEKYYEERGFKSVLCKKCQNTKV